MIKHANVAQGSSEWLRLRMGKPTASSFDRIITTTGKPSSQQQAYVNELLAELIIGAPIAGPSMPWMSRGKEMEEEARTCYELTTDTEVELVGFCTTDDGKIGCSPDGLVGDKGGYEQKCPSPAVHVSYLFSEAGVGGAYKAQVQGCLYVCEREWWDTVSYYPGMPQGLVRTTRDEIFIEELARQLGIFVESLARGIEQITERGWLKAPEPEAVDEGLDWLGITDADVEEILRQNRDANHSGEPA